MKKQLLVLSSFALMLGACNATAQQNYKKTEGGLEYKIIKKGDGTQTPKIGDFADIVVVFKIGDSTIINTNEMNNNQPVPHMFQASQFKGDLNEGLLLMKAGDSAEFRMSMDTLAARSGQPKPDFAKPGAYATWNVKMVNVKDKAQMENDNKAAAAKQTEIDDKLIQDYLTKNNLKTQKTASGLYYIITPSGSTEKPTQGQQITLNYTGMLLDGTKFDSNTDPAFGHVAPFQYKYNVDKMIKGWDEGVDMMHKGDKIKIIMPSYLGYGAQGRPPKIPQNAPLMFEMELVDFQ